MSQINSSIQKIRRFTPDTKSKCFEFDTLSSIRYNVKDAGTKLRANIINIEWSIDTTPCRLKKRSKEWILRAENLNKKVIKLYKFIIYIISKFICSCVKFMGWFIVRIPYSLISSWDLFNESRVARRITLLIAFMYATDDSHPLLLNHTCKIKTKDNSAIAQN